MKTSSHHWVVTWVLIVLVAVHPVTVFSQTADRSGVINISTLNDKPAGTSFTAGFVISGQPRRVLIRVVGRELRNFGVADPVSDTRLNLHREGTLIFGNDDWTVQSSIPGVASSTADQIAEAAARCGAFPLDGAGNRISSAILMTLQPGAYTVQAVNQSSAHGSMLLEVYEVP